MTFPKCLCQVFNANAKDLANVHEFDEINASRTIFDAPVRWLGHTKSSSNLALCEVLLLAKLHQQAYERVVLSPAHRFRDSLAHLDRALPHDLY